MDATPHSPKTDGKYLIKDDLGHYCLKTSEILKRKKVGAAGVQPRGSGLGYQQLQAAWGSPVHRTPQCCDSARDPSN